MTRYVITGGQGFIGRYVAAALLRRQATEAVVSLGRSPRCSTSFAHTASRDGVAVPAPLPAVLRAVEQDPRYDYARVDMGDQPALTALLARTRPTHVIHLAAALHTAPMAAQIATNIAAVQHLMDALAGLPGPPTTVVLGSTCAVYGQPTTLPIPETAAPRPVVPYGVTKLAGEQLALLASSQGDQPVVVARIFNPIGPGQTESHLSSALASQIAARCSEVGEAGTAEEAPSPITVGPLDTSRDFIDVRDVADALVFLADHGLRGQRYNIGRGEETVCQALLDGLLQAADFKRPPSIERTPRRPADIPRHVADIRRLRGLGWSPKISVERSLADTLRWYQQDVSAAISLQNQAESEPCSQQVTPLGAASRRTISVLARRQDSYEVHVAAGLIETLPARLAASFPGARIVVLSETHVAALHGDRLMAAFAAHGSDATLLCMAEGESAKCMATVERVVAQLYEAGFDRRAVLVLFGGGVVIDTGGFIAACYMRGIAYVNVPTTMLAQHDAAVGGKVAVNMPWAKNFVGAFHHPRAVYVDPTVLRTLDDRNMAAGIAEAIKVALCGDRELFLLLERSADLVRAREPERLGEILSRAIGGKVAMLAPDPYEVDLRRVLNLGHSFGHALETELAYAGLLHGEAVAHGIAVATEVSVARGRCTRHTAARIHGLLAAYDLPTFVSEARLAAAESRMDAVRLIRGQVLNFVLPVAMDRVEIVADLEPTEIAAALEVLATRRVAGQAQQVQRAQQIAETLAAGQTLAGGITA